MPRTLTIIILIFLTVTLQPLGVTQDTYSLAGRVTNVLTDNPVSDVTIIITEGDSESASTITDSTGYFMVSDIPVSGPYQIEFLHREYSSVYRLDILASAINIDVELEPNAISIPAAPIANAGPQYIYIDWHANPETSIKGYNLYRTAIDENGEAIGEAVKLNGIPETLLGDLLESAAYIDEDTERGILYIYQVQVVSSVDRLSDLSEPSIPVKANVLTLFIPTVYAPQLQGIAFVHPISGKPLARIPVAVECVYDVVAQAMKLAVDLPSDAFLHDVTNDIRVFPTGLTRRVDLTYHVEVVEDVIRVFIEANGNIPLYGSGALFQIFAVPALVAEGDCVPIQLHTASTVIPVLTDEGYLPISLEVFEGTYCNEAGCIYGDVTNDGRVSVNDAVALLQYLVGLHDISLDHPCFPAVADLNFDGRVDVADVRLILRAITLDFIGLEYPLSSPYSVIPITEQKTEEEAVQISLDIRYEGTSVIAVIMLEGVSDLSGFSVQLGYPADYLYFDSAAKGDRLAEIFTLENKDYIHGENQEHGMVKISTTSQEALDCLEKTEIVLVQFTTRNPNWDSITLPVRVTDFSYNDAEGYTPRHTDPAAPKGYGQSLGQAAALFCTFVNADTMEAITDGTLSIQPAHHSPVSNNTNGVYTMPALEGGSYTLSAASSQYDNAVLNVYIGKGETVSRKIYLIPLPTSEGENEGEGEGEAVEGENDNDDTKKMRILFCGVTSGTDGSSHVGDIVLIMLIAVALLSNRKKRHETL